MAEKNAHHFLYFPPPQIKSGPDKFRDPDQESSHAIAQSTSRGSTSRSIATFADDRLSGTCNQLAGASQRWRPLHGDVLTILKVLKEGL
jgi:hypothetical protein